MTPYNLLKSLLFLLILSGRLIVNGQIPSFTMPASVCMNTPVNVVNTSTGGTTYYWSFCDPDLSQTPQALNIGDPNGLFAQPVFMDIVSENNQYYALLINHYPGELIRLDFGSSLLNIPTATSLGNFGLLNLGYGSEGIQVVRNNGTWYALVVAGDPTSGTESKVVQINFGASITNPAPVATSWGNLGNLLQPIGFCLINDNTNWYGFVANSIGNTVTLLNFGNNFDIPPTAVNLGNPGGFFNYPTSLCPLKVAGSWHLFVTNAYSNEVERLDFGNSLVNVPTAVSLGALGNTISSARDVKIIQFCDQIMGFVADGATNTITRLDFNNDILSIPTATNLGNFGNFLFPHSLSKLFRVGADLYTFVPNVNNNTMTRLRFAGCASSSTPSSTAQNPPAFSYNQPGTYRVQLIMDDGLVTQAAYCQTVTVVDKPGFTLPPDTAVCQGDTLVLKYTGPSYSYLWQNGSTLDTFAVHQPGNYSLTVSNPTGCSTTHSLNVGYTSLPVVTTLPDAILCRDSSLLLQTSASNDDSVRWAPAAGLTDTTVTSPIVTPGMDTRYIVTAWHGGCPARDTVNIQMDAPPVVQVAGGGLICTGQTTYLSANGANSYQWSPSTGLSDSTIADPLAKPDSTRTYQVTGSDIHGCKSTASLVVQVRPPETFAVSPPDVKICKGESVLLKGSGGDPSQGDTYTWSPAGPGQDPNATSLMVEPSMTATYEMTGYDKLCNLSTTLTATVEVGENVVSSISKSNDIDCITGEATLSATGGVRYTWYPAGTLSDPFSPNPVARTDTSTLYYVQITGSNGCSTVDSIQLNVVKTGGNIGFPLANAFTPNGDGHNDCFGVKYWGYIGQFELSVYNRWGQRVFFTNKPDGCWDGTIDGKPQPTGTYVYMIRANTLCGMAFKKGTVELIR